MTETESVPANTSRIALVSQGIAPYRVTLLNRLQSIPGVRITALLSESEWHFQGQPVGLEQADFPFRLFKSFFIPFNTERADKTHFVLSPTLWWHLLSARYDVMIAFGWTMPNSIATLVLCKLRRIPVFLWDTSIPHPPGRLKSIVMPLLKRVFGAYDGYFASSTLASKYFISMGASPACVTLLPQAIDTAFFADAAAEFHPQRAEIKSTFGITTRDVILFVGQLTPRKGLDVLLAAFQQLVRKNDNVTLLLVGEGPLRDELQGRVREMGLDQRVRIHKYVPRPELPRLYAMSDVFVLPSWYDTFGVVIAEAMACGLPVVTTTSVGAAYDLVRENENGFVVEYGDREGLAVALEKLTGDQARRAEMAECSRKIITGWNLELAAKNFEQALSRLLPRDPDIRHDA